MSIEIKKDKKSKKKDNLQEVCDNIDNIYDKKCSHNKQLFQVLFMECRESGGGLCTGQ